ncbi:MAG TPA: hypothetical protein VFL86_28400 [Burkholderiaceae bacterium]|nr:hypothetical protein [Burkholderiaceae bacterium]
MKPLTPEFIAPRQPPPLWWWAAGMLAVAVLADGALMLWQQAQVQDLARQLKAATDTPRPPAVPIEPPAPPAYADSARELLAEQGPGWADTLRALEHTAMLGVTPIAVEVQSRERSARIEVEFADYAVLMRYLEQLNAGLQVAEWSLVSAQRPVGGTNAGPSTAVLMRRW